jgi:predicted oxidoreductase
MNPQEIGEAFSQLKQEGKVLHFGVSNFTPSQIDIMMSAFKVEFNQLEVSILHLDPFHDGSLDKCIQHNIRPMAWGPLEAENFIITTVMKELPGYYQLQIFSPKNIIALLIKYY